MKPRKPVLPPTKSQKLEAIDRRMDERQGRLLAADDAIKNASAAFLECSRLMARCAFLLEQACGGKSVQWNEITDLAEVRRDLDALWALTPQSPPQAESPADRS